MRTFTGVAREAAVKSITFEDPAWEATFDELIKLTQRTEFIAEVTGTTIKNQRLKEAVTKRLEAMGFVAKKPRGKKRKEDSKSFLHHTAEQSDAAYLAALHTGCRDIETSDSQNLNMRHSLQRHIQIYHTYVKDLYGGNQEDAKVSFESYMLLISALKKRDRFSMVTCSDCGSRQPTSRGQNMRWTCQICKHHALDAKAARERLNALIAQKTNSMFGSVGRSNQS